MEDLRDLTHLSRRGLLGVGAGTVAAQAMFGEVPGAAASLQATSTGPMPTTLGVNGTRQAFTADPRTTLLDALREQLGLCDSKKGYDYGQCGACTQIRDKLATAAVADGKSPLAARDASKLTLVNGTSHSPDGRREALAEALEPVGGGGEMLAGNEPKNGQPGALAGLRAGELAFSGGNADKDSVKFAFGAEYVEVRVHRLSREVRVSRLVGAFAAGTIINSVTARGQLPGGMFWGISAALHQANEIDRRHTRHTNKNFAEYLIPVNADIPGVELLFVAETDREVNALGIKGVGELGGVSTNAVVCNAIFHAAGIHIRELPVRIEKLLQNA